MSSHNADSNNNAVCSLIGGDDGRGDGYSPSPYPISIMPQVRISKPRPTHVRSADVPPTPLERRADAEGPDESGVKIIIPPVCPNETDEQIQQQLKEAGSGIELTSSPSVTPEGTSKQTTPRRKRRGNTNNQSSATKTTESDHSNQSNNPKSKIIEVISTEDNNGQTDESFHKTAKSPKQQPIQNAIQCATCNEHKARYTCPKCQAPYCSVSCYRIHDGSINNDSSSNNVKICTEAFYKHRVLDSIGSNGKNDNNALRGVLARMHRDINDNLDSVEAREESISTLLKESDKNRIVNDVQNDVRAENISSERASAMRIEPQNNNTQVISDEDLAELAEYVLQMEEDEDESGGEHGNNRGLLESIPPHLLYAFECALASATEASQNQSSDGSAQDVSNASGEGTAEKKNMTLENAWAPFMASDEMSTKQDDVMQDAAKDQAPANQVGESSNAFEKQCTLWWLPSNEGGEAGGETMLSTFDAPTLDDRIVALPPLPKLCSSTKNTSLAYNILEVVYAAAFVTRAKYNSLRSVKRSANAAISPVDLTPVVSPTIDEASMLLSQSNVLANDARYGSVQEVMIACAEQLVENKKLMPASTLRLISPIYDSKHVQDDLKENKVISWETLAMDVSIISRHRRFVLRILFEACDMCQSSLDCIRLELKQIKKSQQQKHDATNARGVESKQELEDNKRKYKLATKKIEYFLSWCASMWSVELGQELSEEVRAFVADWSSSEENAQDEKESAVERLIRGIHDSSDGTSFDDESHDNGLLLRGGILNLGGGGKKQLPSLMEDQMISISTVRKKPESSQFAQN